MQQIYELMWPVKTVAYLKPDALTRFEELHIDFRDDDNSGTKWAAFVVDEGDEVLITHKGAQSRVSFESSWHRERTPREVLQLFLDEAGLGANMVEWVADQW